MATNFTNLTINQKAVADAIIGYGRDNGYSDAAIKTVLHIANQESNLGAIRSNPKSSATGIFHFLRDGSFDLAFNDFKAQNQNSQYAALSASTALNNDAATIAVMFNRVEGLQQQFSIGNIRLTSQLVAIGEAGVDVFSDVNLFAYFNHNTNASESINIYTINGSSIVNTNGNLTGYLDNYISNNAGTQRVMANIPSTPSVIHQYISGPARIVLPGGAEAVLNEATDNVIGNGTQFLIQQGQNQTWIDVSSGNMAECRSTGWNFYGAFRTSSSIHLHGLGATCGMSANGNLYVAPNNGFRPFEVTPEGKFLDPNNPNVLLITPPLIKSDGSGYLDWNLHEGATSVAISEYGVIQTIGDNQLCCTVDGNEIIFGLNVESLTII